MSRMPGEPRGSGEDLGARRVDIGGIGFDPITASGVVTTFRTGAAARKGGLIITPNIDHLSLFRRGVLSSELLEQADLVVADGMPLVWASLLKGEALPERVSGADLVPLLCRAAAQDGLGVAFVGGRPDAARRASDLLALQNPGLKVSAVLCPERGFDSDPRRVDELCRELASTEPAVVFTALGAPRQEALNTRMHAQLPSAWFLACGGTLEMIAGMYPRAPRWMRRTGTEWLWRLALEPRRLARRYLVEDLPTCAWVLARSAVTGLRRRRAARPVAWTGGPGGATLVEVVDTASRNPPVAPAIVPSGGLLATNDRSDADVTRGR